ncbi:rRNA-processing protein las1 [Coemansia sp. RSA 1200]|nr:rRNA-processing protein las1 [Coemansia sp. RSA 1200]
MSRFPKVVPWASTAEYMDVGECLFSPNLSQRKRGVTVVKAWRARSRIPAAIEATANLVEMAAIDEEAQQTQNSHRCSNQQLRHMYTMALVRFVNTIVDLEQRGLYAQSVASLAAKIGMPAWFVELRHAGTHDHIPSLPVLRSACAQAVHWLGDYYWSRQTARTMPEDTQQQIRQAVARYATAAAATAAGLESAKLRSDADHEEMNTAKAGLADLVARLHSDAVRLHLVPVLVEQRFLVSDEKKLRAKFPDCRLAPEFIARWEFPLGLFCDTWGRSLFLEELVSGIVAALVPPASADLGLFETGDSSLSTSHAATLVAWVRWVLEQSNNNIDLDAAKAAGGSLNVDVFDNGQTAVDCIINIDDILEACLRNPGYYTRAVLKVISDVIPGLKRELKPFVDYMGKALAALVAIESGSGSSKVGNKLKKKPVASEKDLQDEEDVMRDRLSSVLGKNDAESIGMDVDNADSEINEAASVNTPGARNAAATSSELAATFGRWAPAPVCAGTVPSIGTLADGSVPPLEWPAWLDDVPLQAASAN